MQFAYQNFTVVQLLQIAVDLLCPGTNIPSIGLHNASNESQSKYTVRRSRVILLSLTTFISVFGRFLPPTHREWTTLIFTGHNLLSSAMIMKRGVDTLVLLKARNLVGVSLECKRDVQGRFENRFAIFIIVF
jgi:hypothetical protein